MLAQCLESRTRPVLILREPGGTDLGERIRDLLLSRRAEGEMSPEAELMLFLASRAQLVSQVVEPGLRSGKIVICDRYSDSTVAYQAFGRGLDRKAVVIANQVATGGLVPDVTILLDMDVARGVARVEAPNRFDTEPEAFHEAVRSGFLQIAAEEPDRVKVVDASRSKVEVAEDVWRIVEDAVFRAPAE